jgi:ribonuclease VapC
MIVLDASALLAFLFREKGHANVARHFGSCCISSVNLSEVIGRFVRDGHDGDAVLRRLEAAPIEVVAFDSRDAVMAASLLPATRAAGLSFADRACLALAKRRAIPALTADAVWGSLDLGVAVQLIR